MARKLVFQEGKRIDGEYFIASIFDTEVHKMIECVIFNLECDMFHASLLAPWNSDSRYHFLVEKIDLLPEDSLGKRRMFISSDPTQGLDENEDQVRVEPNDFVRSEMTRRRVLERLISRRELEEIMSRQRMIRMEILGRRTSRNSSGVRPNTNSTLSMKKFERNDDIQMSATRRDACKGYAALAVKVKLRQERVTTELGNVPLPLKEASIDESGFLEGEKVFNALICKINKGIIDYRLVSLSENNAIKRLVLDSKERAWLDMRSAASSRVACKRVRFEQWEKLESKRLVNISQKQSRNNLVYGVCVNDRKTNLKLKLKQLVFRVGEQRKSILRMKQIELEKRNIQRMDSDKMNIIRNRNIEIKLEIRDRRLKEIRWTQERLPAALDFEAKFSSGASVVESLKSHRTSNNASHLGNMKTEEEETEKVHFLESLDRTERLNDKIARKSIPDRSRKTPAQLEVEKYEMWKLRQLDGRERFISLKQKKFQDKRDEALHIRDKLLRDAKITSDSEKKRQEQWRIADKHLNESVIETAIARVTFIDELIPTLMLF